MQQLQALPGVVDYYAEAAAGEGLDDDREEVARKIRVVAICLDDTRGPCYLTQEGLLLPMDFCDNFRSDLGFIYDALVER